MSAPTSTSQTPRQPLNERSQSQNNTLAIRVVPYSPPRLDDGQAPSSAAPSASRYHDSRNVSSTSDDRRLGSSIVNLRKRTTPDSSGESPGSPGYALSPSPSVASLATVRGESVSGSIASEASAGPPKRGTPPALNTPPYSSNIPSVYAPSQPSQHDDDLSDAAAGAGSSQHRPLPRRRNIITLHADKTFSLIPHRQPDGGLRSPRLSFSTTSFSSDPFTDDTPSSPVTTLPERSRSISPCTLTSSPTPPTLTQLADDLNSPLPLPTPTPTTTTSSSPWNYRLVGGLRKVPKTPDLKRSRPNPAQSLPDAPLAQLHAAAAAAPAPTTTGTTSPLATKSSFQSSQSASTTSETTNYKVYAGSSSPCLPDNLSLAPSSDGSNYQLLGPSSSPAPSIDQPPPPSSGSDENYVVHGGPSPSPSSSVVRVKRRVEPRYSQESLVVPPLRPGKKSSAERLGYYTSRSRESLRRVGSLTSITSILSQEATQSLLSSPAALYLQGGPLAFSNRRQDPWAASSSSSSPTTRQQQQQQMIAAHPHQWSSQLSTVASESEGGSERGTLSRTGSPLSYPGRRSSGFPSNHSRHMLSISSSMGGQDDGSPSHSRSASDSLDRPQPSYMRHGHLVRDPDEHGDGLTDLEALQQRPSRTRLSSFFSSMSSDRNLHSSASSRANSFNSSSLPAWARVYYGSGERKLLKPSSESMISEYNDSRPPSSFQSGSPSIENFPPNIYSQRRWPREVAGHRPRSSSGSMGSMAIANMPAMPSIPGWSLGTRIRKQTSSIWSPHLRHDQRASRYSIWEPPSVNWSAESGPLGRRNIQVVMFIVGFVFPFAWMIAAVLPLPPDPQQDKREPDVHTSHTDFRRSLRSRVHVVDTSQHQGALWWRQLNRYMSLVGLLVIAAVVILTVLGVRQGWGSQP